MHGENALRREGGRACRKSALFTADCMTVLNVSVRGRRPRERISAMASIAWATKSGSPRSTTASIAL